LTAYLLIAFVVMLSLYLEVLPTNLVSGFAVTMTIGGLLSWLGDSVPGLRAFGGAPILCIVIPALFVSWGVFPESGVVIIDAFFAVFLDLFISALIVGSILSMDRQTLISAGGRMVGPVLGAILLTFLIGGAVGHLTGLGFGKAILYVVAPIMGGGIGAGAIPMSEMYASRAGGDSAEFLSLLVPAVMVGNLVCILVAAVLNGLGKRHQAILPGFSGEGRMLRVSGATASISVPEEVHVQSTDAFGSMAVGVVVACALYVFGNLVASVVPGVHAYAWMIVATALIKAFDCAPASIQAATGEWYAFVSKTWIPAILVAVSISLIDIEQVMVLLGSPAYILLTILTVAISSVGAGLVGWLVGMHFVEAAITAGLCMADAGGSGDVAVLGASDRLHLMPFAQMSSRLGGALILLIMSVLIPFLM
jgi:Na+/citrate or Na+/malate symporter